jgi:hypothetical protein
VGRVITEGEGERERLRLGQLAWAQTEQEWALLELRPLHGVAAGSLAGSHLLSLPAGVEPLARRWTPGGLCVCELVGKAPSLDRLLEGWRREGWEVQRSDLRTETGAGVRCHKGAVCIQVWSFAAPMPPRENYLLLIRLPLGPEAGRIPNERD